MVKKRHQHRKISRKQQKQYDTIKVWRLVSPDFFLMAAAAFTVEDVNFVMVSYDRCCVIFFVFLK
jgi:hypothetical protein